MATRDHNPITFIVIVDILQHQANSSFKKKQCQ